MNQDAFDKGLKTRREVLGAEYVDAAIKNADDFNQPMQELVAHRAQAVALRAQAVRDGYIPMREYGWHKVMKGETTIEEVISVTSSDIGGAE